MTYYLQINPQTNIITDAITYPYGDYIPYETDNPLPNGCIGGWFKYTNGEIIEFPELKPKDITTESIVSRLELAESAINDLVLGGII